MILYFKYSFWGTNKPELVELLEDNNINYDFKDETKKHIEFIIYSNAEYFDRVINSLKNLKMPAPLIFEEYTKEEIDSAQLLIIRPDRHSAEITNGKTAYEKTCCWKTSDGWSMVKHMSQKDLFKIKKELPMKSSAAFSWEDTGTAEVFTDSRVLKLVQDNSLRGFAFERVFIKKGVFSENTYQLKSTNIITKEKICRGKGEKAEFCRFCGREQIVPCKGYQLHLKGTPDDYTEDMYMTEAVFGPGIDRPWYIISQRFYRLLQENKLAGKLGVNPVVIENKSEE